MNRTVSFSRALRTRLTPLAAVMAASFLVAACGGGGDTKLSLNENGEISLQKKPGHGSSTKPGNTGGNPSANGNTASGHGPSASGGTGGSTHAGTPGTVNGSTNAGGNAGVQANETWVINSIARIKASRNAPHEGTSPEMWSTYWSSSGAVLNPVAPARTRALGAFGQIFAVDEHNTSLVDVQLRNMETYVRSEGKWRRVQYSNKVRTQEYYPGYEERGRSCSPDCSHAVSSGGVGAKTAKGTFIRFWPEAAFTESLIAPEKIEAVFTTVQARIVNNTSSGDYRKEARYLVNIGATWATRDWRKSSTEDGAMGTFNSDVLTDVGVGNLVLMTNDWQSVNFTTATDAQIDELAQAGEGRAPIANSLDKDNNLTRIIVVGDDLVQGTEQSTGVAQDSFRRVLWNGLVSDPNQPRINFVGRRKGPFATDHVVGACTDEITRTNTAYYTKYFFPEFDTAHQGYGGHCADQIARKLPKVLDDLAWPRETPDVAIVSIGTSNLRTDTSPESINKAISGLKEVITNLRAGNDGMTILAAQIPPILTSTGLEDPNVARYNARIAAEIPALSSTRSKVIVVDTHTGFTPGMLRNAYLPNDEGEAFLASRWLQALKQNNLVND